jgi:hypothetical protein
MSALKDFLNQVRATGVPGEFRKELAAFREWSRRVHYGFVAA